MIKNKPVSHQYIKGLTKFFLFVAILSSVISCNKIPVAQVGKSFIFPQDIKDEKGIQEAYGANFTDEEILLILFQKKLREYVLLEKLGVKITPQMVQREKERIDRETKAPEILNRVKKYFHGNEKKYLKKYVYPVLVSRLLENAFYFDTIIQREPYTLAQKKLRELIKNPDMNIKSDSLYIFLDLEEINSKHNGGFFYPSILSKIDTLTLKSIPIKGVYPKLIEDKLGYYILRKLDKKAKKFDGFFIRKKDFNRWFRKNIRDVNIYIFDLDLKKRVLSRAGNSYIKRLIVDPNIPQGKRETSN